MDYRNRNRTGTIGTRTTAKREGVTVADKAPLPEGPVASVGLSASVGHARDYGSTKFDVSCWVTMPSALDERSKASTLDRCRDIVYDRLEQMRDEVAEKFFPDVDSWG
jgi:hypothetical protein